MDELLLRRRQRALRPHHNHVGSHEHSDVLGEAARHELQLKLADRLANRRFEGLPLLQRLAMHRLTARPKADLSPAPDGLLSPS